MPPVSKDPSGSPFISSLLSKGWTVGKKGELNAPTTPVKHQVKAVVKSSAQKKVKKGGMNQTEQRFWSDFIKPGLDSGEYVKWRFEPIRFNLTEDATYTPDFMVVSKTGAVAFYEIKNSQVWEDSIVKFKWARSEHPQFKFYFFQFTKQGGWKEKLLRK